MYVEKLRRAIERMSWDEIYYVVTKAKFIFKPDDDAPYFVVLVRPADDKRSKCDATINTHAVFHLLFRKHRKEFKREYRELFHLLSRNRKTTEADHDMLEEGIDVHGTIIALQ